MLFQKMQALDAFQARFGERALADYDFSKAEVIISFGADFLGDWQGGGFDGGYAKGRVPANGKMSRHVSLNQICLYQVLTQINVYL